MHQDNLPRFQPFRRAHTSSFKIERVVYIRTHYHQGLNRHVVFWSGMLEYFPFLRYIRQGTTILKFLTDSDFKAVEPRCIATFPDEILEVIMEDQLGESSVASPPSVGTPLRSVALPSLVPNTKQQHAAAYIPEKRADRPQKGVQAIRLASKSKTVHIATHFDSSSENEIVLWNDVLVVFREALYLQDGINVIPFLKGSDFRDLDPPRLPYVPGVTLDVVLEDSPAKTGSHSPPSQQVPQELIFEPSQETLQRAAFVNQAPTANGRNPHGHVELAIANYSHMEAPRTGLPGPQLYSSDSEDNSST